MLLENNNLGGFLVNKKPKTNTLNESGIYQLKYKYCDIVCIGHPGRDIKNSINEHVTIINLNTAQQVLLNIAYIK